MVWQEPCYFIVVCIMVLECLQHLRMELKFRCVQIHNCVPVFALDGWIVCWEEVDFVLQLTENPTFQPKFSPSPSEA